jgi:hypothetical protein
MQSPFMACCTQVRRTLRLSLQKSRARVHQAYSPGGKKRVTSPPVTRNCTRNERMLREADGKWLRRWWSGGGEDEDVMEHAS